MSKSNSPTGTGNYLDNALSAALRPPPVPLNLRAMLLAAVHAESLNDLQARRLALEEEHRRTLEGLRAGHVQLKRNTLALVVVIAFTVGACANLVLPWLSSITGVSSPVMVPLMALAIGMGTGFRVWWERLGPYR